jgi:hypothetical protein
MKAAVRMSEAERNRYNRDVRKVDRLKANRRAAKTATEREALTEQLRRAYIAFDETWNGYTPTEEMLARWLEN